MSNTPLTDALVDAVNRMEQEGRDGESQFDFMRDSHEAMELKSNELLAALKEALRWADQDCPSACMNAVQRARATIEKAENVRSS